jgi:pyruvate/2-oxoglutarate/acetoin dehydrogenase E1 component
MGYREELIKAMLTLAEDERVIFIGQTILYPGNVIYGTLEGISASRKIELPIMEDCQMGMSIGLSLEGYLPVSIFPRMDFLIIAMNQLVNHLDKIEEMSSGRFKPKVIIRTMVGATKPLYPGVQHCSDYTEGLGYFLRNINVVKLTEAEQIVPEYRKSLESERSTILIEMGDLY